MRKFFTNKLSLLLAAMLLVATAQLVAEQQSHILWVINDGEEVDKPQAERLYAEACRWIEERFESRKAVRPNLTVYVGRACPDPEIDEACLSVGLGEVYIPTWNDTAPGMITNATLATAMFHLMDKNEMRNVVQHILNDDARNFVSARSAEQRREE